MGYSLAITAYCQTCNSSHRAKDNERKQTSRTPERKHNETAVDKTAVFIQADKNGLRRL